MPRTTYSAIVIVILAMGMLSSNARAAAKFASELSQIEIALPGDRWSLRKSDERDRGERVRAWITDSENVANIFFLEIRRQGRYATIDEWLEKRVIPRWLKKYGKDDYTVQSKDKGEATLGSGQRVKIVKYSLLIHDNNYRDVRFAYFTNGEGTRWSYLFVSNKGKDRDQEDAFREIMKGITLRAAPPAKSADTPDTKENLLAPNTKESLLAKARSMQGRPLSGKEIREFFDGNTLTYRGIRIFYKNKSTRLVNHPRRGEFSVGWSVRDDGTYCHEGYKGGQSCRNNLRTSIEGDRVIVYMTWMRGRSKGRVLKGLLLPGNQLRLVGPFAGTIQLTKLVVDEILEAGEPYRVELHFKMTGNPKIEAACFFWDFQGPFCRRGLMADSLSGIAMVTLKTANPDQYTLSVYVKYLSKGKAKDSNRVSAEIDVR